MVPRSIWTPRCCGIESVSLQYSIKPKDTNAPVDTNAPDGPNPAAAADDLTQLRHVYTYWRNRARAARRAGQKTEDLENTAKAAAKQYHDAVRQRKSPHWDEFLAGTMTTSGKQPST